MSSKGQDQCDSVTGSEVNGSDLFDFGPDVERPAAGPQAAVPPWMAPHEPLAGQTLAARLQSAPAGAVDVIAVDVVEIDAAEFELGDDATPEPVVVPDFARTVPAPRKRRKPLPPDRVVIAAPAVVDGSGNVVEGAAPLGTETETDAETEFGALLPTQRTEADPAPGAPDGPGPELAPSVRRRPRWVGLAQAAAIVAVGATVGIFAAGGLGFLDSRAQANPPTAEAGTWVLNHLAGVGTVLIPASMTEGLIQNGHDADALTTYPDGSAEAIDLGKNCCSYIVLAGAPDQEAGTGLPPSVRTLFERSRPAAVFTTDGGWTQIRQVLPGAPAKVAADLEADRAALVATGKSLIASGRVELSDVATTQLQNGEVDARVLIGIIAVALEHKISIASFPAQPGEVDAGILRRSVAISEIGGKAVKTGSDRVNAIKDTLARQAGIYRPAGAEVHPVDGANALEVRYDAPSPFGVLTLNDENGNRS